MTTSKNPLYTLTFTVRKRRRPYNRYNGVLRTHRFYIEYYRLLDGQEPLEVIEKSEPLVAFPVRFKEFALEFARELGGEVIGNRRIEIGRSGFYYDKQVIVLPNEIAFRRHLLFTLTVSTYRTLGGVRFNSLKNILLTMNANLLNIMSTMVIDRYNEWRVTGKPMWMWYMLRVARALKVLYRLD